MSTTTDILDQVARAAVRATAALTDRDDAIRRALADGASLRAVGSAAGLTHTAVAKIRDRR